MSKSSLSLIPHPSGKASSVSGIKTDVAIQADTLKLAYTLRAPIDTLLIPPECSPKRRDQLWQHSCFEVFIKTTTGYEEYNFSPSTEWAHYRFTDYRKVVETESQIPAPQIAVSHDNNSLTLRTSILPPPNATALGLAAVIEDLSGNLYYWALTHPAAQPDFHHPDAFALKLE